MSNIPPPPPSKDCPPFSPCWCETRPNNPNCDGVAPLPISNGYLSVVVIVLICVFLKLKNTYEKIQTKR